MQVLIWSMLWKCSRSFGRAQSIAVWFIIPSRAKMMLVCIRVIENTHMKGIKPAINNLLLFTIIFFILNDLRIFSICFADFRHQWKFVIQIKEIEFLVSWISRCLVFCSKFRGINPNFVNLLSNIYFPLWKIKMLKVSFLLLKNKICVKENRSEKYEDLSKYAKFKLCTKNSLALSLSWRPECSILWNYQFIPFDENFLTVYEINLNQFRSNTRTAPFYKLKNTIKSKKFWSSLE